MATEMSAEERSVILTVCQDTLTSLKQRLFKPDVHITLVVRVPNVEEGDMVITTDDLDKVLGSVLAARNMELRGEG